MNKRITIYIEDEKLIEAIKKAAKHDDRSMTKYFKTAVVEKMKREGRWQKVEDAA